MSSAPSSRTPVLQGVIAAMLTPMRDAGTRVDVEAATRLVSRLVDRGVHGLYVAGTTGEGLYLSPEEHRDLSRAAVKAARNVPVVVHVGALTTAVARACRASSGFSGRDPLPPLNGVRRVLAGWVMEQLPQSDTHAWRIN